MGVEQVILLVVLGITTVINIVSVFVLRDLSLRLVSSVVAYRVTSASRPTAAKHELEEGGMRSPLQDVFQQYSKLTGRMADIIFQLTESRQLSREAALAAARAIQEDANLAVMAPPGSMVLMDGERSASSKSGDPEVLPLEQHARDAVRQGRG